MMAMTRSHEISADLHVRTIASYYGFRSTRALEEHPDNAPLVAQRGSLDLLEPGDVVSIPDGQRGARDLGTGRVHRVLVSSATTVLQVRVYTEFRLPPETTPGNKEETEARWLGFGASGIRQLEATVTVTQRDGSDAGRPLRTTNSRNGTLEVPGLDDGRWRILIEPSSSETSTAPASADPDGDHGIGKGSVPNNGTYQVEYRSVLIDVDVQGGQIASAEIATAKPSRRPHHAVLFWVNVGESSGRQVLEVDWRPDFLRRYQPSKTPVMIRPLQKKRTPLWDKIPNKTKLIIVHHTAGYKISGALSSFTRPSLNSGAHFLVDVDGHVVRMADDQYWTLHGGGGKSKRPPSWDNKTNPTVNDRAIGIEIVHGGVVDQLFGSDKIEKKDRPFSDAQYETLIGLIEDLKTAYGVTSRRIIGHQDATLKGGCPSPFFEWEQLEAAGIALAPESLSDTEQDEMFGGFFAGVEGRDRLLHIHSAEKLDAESGTFVVDHPGKGESVTGLATGPIEELRDALVETGYGARVPLAGDGIFVEIDGEKKKAMKHQFDWVLGFCLCQFIRRYCTGSRLRSESQMRLAYRDSPRVPDKLYLDFELAVLIKGAEKAARRVREQEGP
jgi:N-acetyl-anhydromuramyl-L-alanine amidase AmpD